MWLRALLAGACLAGGLSGCAVVDPVDSRYDTVGRSLAKARNEAIFLNLVRASHDYPLSFTTIANVTPTMTNTSQFALPTFGLGPPICFGSVGLNGAGCTFPTSVPGRETLVSSSTASNSTAVSTNFNVATQETGSFYAGFLKPIDLQTLDYFIRQEYPRELLFWLFADRFEVGPIGPRALGYQYDPPHSYGCSPPDPLQRCFREWVWVAVLSGLTVEEKTIVKATPSAGPSESSDQSSRASKPQTTVVARFCFSPQLARQAEAQMGEDLARAIRAKYMRGAGIPNPLCGTWTEADAKQQAQSAQPDTFELTVGGQKFRIVPRSAYGVFEFLGSVIKLETQHLQPSDKAYLPRVPPGRPDETEPPTLLTTDNEDLIRIVNSNDSDCFAHTWFFDGDYCVPESATNTKRIFSLLAQLIAIETAATDLSITPVVRVIQ